MTLQLLAWSALLGLPWPFLAQSMFFVWKGFVSEVQRRHSAFDPDQNIIVSNVGDAASLGPYGAGSLGVAAVLCHAMGILTLALVLQSRPERCRATGDADALSESLLPPLWRSMWFRAAWAVALSFYAGPLILAWIGRILPAEEWAQRLDPF